MDVECVANPKFHPTIYCNDAGFSPRILLNIQLLSILLCLEEQRGPQNAVFGVFGKVCLCLQRLELPVSPYGQSLPDGHSISIQLLPAE